MSSYDGQETTIGVHEPDWMEPKDPEKGSTRWLQLGQLAEVKAPIKPLGPIEITLTVEAEVFWEKVGNLIPITPDTKVWIGVPTVNKTETTA